MFKKFASFLGFVLFALLAPCLALAQDNASPSLEEKFGGWYIDIDAQAGAGYYAHGEGGFSFGYGDNYKGYVDTHHENITLNEYVLNHENVVKPGGLIKLNGGYLFGIKQRVFMGPEVSVSTAIGFEFHRLANVDARMRLVVPVIDGHAIDLAFGLGWNMAEMSWSYSGKNGLYIPMQLGYNYTFDNGFMIGCSFEFRLEFMRGSEQYFEEHPESMEYVNQVLAYPGWMGAGIHLGYRFGHHE